MTNVIHGFEDSRSKFERHLQKADFPGKQSARPFYVRDKFYHITIFVLAVLMGSTGIGYPKERKSQISYLSDASLQFFHQHQLANVADYYFRTACSLIDYNIRFHGGCGWILAWEANIGSRLGRGIRFIKDEVANPHALNLMFAKKPIEKISTNSKIDMRQEITKGCAYIVYITYGGDVHMSFLDERKYNYNSCIAKSVLNYQYYSNRSMANNGTYFEDLMRLYVALSGTESLTDDISSAVSVIDGIMR